MAVRVREIAQCKCAQLLPSSQRQSAGTEDPHRGTSAGDLSCPGRASPSETAVQSGRHAHTTMRYPASMSTRTIICKQCGSVRMAPRARLTLKGDCAAASWVSAGAAVAGGASGGAETSDAPVSATSAGACVFASVDAGDNGSLGRLPARYALACSPTPKAASARKNSHTRRRT